mgnify:FL=1
MKASDNIYGTYGKKSSRRSLDNVATNLPETEKPHMHPAMFNNKPQGNQYTLN